MQPLTSPEYVRQVILSTLTSDDCGFIFSESDEECQEVQDIQQEIPSTLYPLSNAEDAGPEVGDDFASELGY